MNKENTDIHYDDDKVLRDLDRQLNPPEKTTVEEESGQVASGDKSQIAFVMPSPTCAASGKGREWMGVEAGGFVEISTESSTIVRKIGKVPKGLVEIAKEIPQFDRVIYLHPRDMQLLHIRPMDKVTVNKSESNIELP